MRPWFVAALCLSFQIVAAFGIEEERERDAYQIYSLLLTARTSEGAGNNSRYLIRAIALVERRHPVPCVSPPKAREEDFREVLTCFCFTFPDDTLRFPTTE